MAFCIKCGQQLKDNDVFCPNCGTPVEKNKKMESSDQRIVDYQDQIFDTFSEMKNTTVDYFQNDRSGFIDKFIGQNNVVGLLACALILIANFLPFASVSLYGYSQSVSLMDSGKDGIIFLVAAIVTIVFIILKNDMLALIAGVITGGLGIYEILDTNSQLGSYAAYVDKGAGYYLLLIGAVLLLASVIVKKFVIK